MRRHVVGAFIDVQIVRSVFGHKPVEYHVEVVAHVGVGVLVEGKCS